MKTTELNLPSQGWVHHRMNYLGGSDVAAALGRSPYKTPLQLWLEKTGRQEPEVSNSVAEFGQVFEPVMAAKFQQQTGMRLRNITEPYQHQKHPFLRANIDRQIVSGPNRSTGVLELKTTTSWRLKALDGDYPDDWYDQLQHYLMLTGYDYAYLFVFERDTAEYHHPKLIERDKGRIKQNTDRLIEWWHRYVVQDQPPEPVNTDDTLLLYPESHDSVVTEASEHVLAQLHNLRKIKDRKKELDQQEEALKTTIQEYMGSAEKLVYGGQTLATWKNQQSVRLDSRKLKQEQPDIYQKFSQTNHTRRFTLK